MQENLTVPANKLFSGLKKESFSKEQIGVRLREARDALGISRDDASKQVAVHKNTLKAWEIGEREASIETIYELSRLYKVNPAVLLFGVDLSRGISDSPETKEPSEDEYIYIPAYDIEVSAGQGMFNDEVQHARKHLAFRRRWIKARNLQADRLAVVFTKGDSMTPTIPENAAIVVDMARNQALDGKVYVIRIDNRLYVKRTQWLPPAGLRLISDNKHYDSIDISESDFAANDVEVIGQVIHAAYDLPD